MTDFRGFRPLTHLLRPSVGPNRFKIQTGARHFGPDWREGTAWEALLLAHCWNVFGISSTAFLPCLPLPSSLFTQKFPWHDAADNVRLCPLLLPSDFVGPNFDDFVVRGSCAVMCRRQVFSVVMALERGGGTVRRLGMTLQTSLGFIRCELADKPNIVTS